MPPFLCASRPRKSGRKTSILVPSSRFCRARRRIHLSAYSRLRPRVNSSFCSLPHLQNILRNTKTGARCNFAPSEKNRARNLRVTLTCKRPWRDTKKLSGSLGFSAFSAAPGVGERENERDSAPGTIFRKSGKNRPRAQASAYIPFYGAAVFRLFPNVAKPRRTREGERVLGLKRVTGP